MWVLSIGDWGSERSPRPHSTANVPLRVPWFCLGHHIAFVAFHPCWPWKSQMNALFFSSRSWGNQKVSRWPELVLLAYNLEIWTHVVSGNNKIPPSAHQASQRFQAQKVYTRQRITHGSIWNPFCLSPVPIPGSVKAFDRQLIKSGLCGIIYTQNSILFNESFLWLFTNMQPGNRSKTSYGV